MRGICHRCWREGELLNWWPISKECFKKIPKKEHIHTYTPTSFYLNNIEKIDEIKKGRIPTGLNSNWIIFYRDREDHQKRILNFLPIHFHYDLSGSLSWGEKKMSELDLAINIMALACPPVKKYGEIPSVKLAGGSIISEDIWTWHHFFCHKFIDPIPYEGGSINLQEVSDWIVKINAARKGEFPIGQIRR